MDVCTFITRNSETLDHGLNRDARRTKSPLFFSEKTREEIEYALLTDDNDYRNQCLRELGVLS
jgi:hypothetical protein